MKLSRGYNIASNEKSSRLCCVERKERKRNERERERKREKEEHLDAAVISLQ